MPKYSVVIEGANFPARLLDDAGGLVGFFTTRYINAADVDAAELAAIDLIKLELRPLLSGQKEGEVNPLLYLNEISKIAKLPEHAPGSGYTWFPMQG